jgi:uncharacterized protein (TIGR03382 family)
MRGSVVAALAGLSVCGVAAAQTLRVELTFGSTSIAVGETTTATLTAYFTGHPAVAYGLDVFSSSTIVWVPAPGMMGFAAVAGLAALRRRR